MSISIFLDSKRSPLESKRPKILPPQLFSSSNNICSRMILKQGSLQVLCEKSRTHLVSRSPYDTQCALLFQLTKEVPVDSFMLNTTANSPVIGQVNTSDIATFQDNGLCNLQFHQFQDVHVIQHILCALHTRGSLSLSHQQGCSYLHPAIHSDWTTIKKRGVSTNTPTVFRIRDIIRICLSTDGEFKVLAAIPLCIWPQGQSMIRCINTLVHGAFHGLYISPCYPLHWFLQFTHRIYSFSPCPPYHILNFAYTWAIHLLNALWDPVLGRSTLQNFSRIRCSH